MSTDNLYLNSDISFEERAADLVSKMSLEEKCLQMVYNSPAIPRLGIPAYNWWNEALHGIARAGVATMFPQAIALAATFNEELIFRIADVISTEGRAKYHEFERSNDIGGIYKGLTFWSPNLNIFRDPRWGRGHETFGEDPFLTSRLGVAFIKGMQGNHSKYLKTAACAKHFAVHSGPEAERHSFNAEVSQKDLWETYLPAFEAAVKEARVESVMGAYNRTNGEPCCGSKTLLVDILRNKWGFKGHVTSDCWAIKDFHENHMITKTAPESVALAVNNGCDLNCGNMYLNLMIAHNEGLVSEETIDRSVTRLMMTRMKLGMFDNPKNVPYASIPFELNDCKEHNMLSLEAAKKAMVLLKNKDNILPLDKSKLKSVAIIGPNADSRDSLVGNYNGTASQYITVLQGIREAVEEDTRIYYSEGCHLYKGKESWKFRPMDRESEAVSAAKMADVAIVCLGLDASIEGEEGDQGNIYASGDKPDLKLPGLQQKLLEAVHNTGTPVILVLLSGSALSVGWADENIPAIVQAWYPGSLGGRAVASMLFGEYSPSGRLPVTFYKTTEELPDFKDYSMRNRTYRYMKQEALYPFGYGLGYTKFSYTPTSSEHKTIRCGEETAFSVKAENIGDFSSDEVVQCYIRDVEASVDVPKWSLRGVKIITLAPQESKEVEFLIKSEDLMLINNEGNKVTEAGEFEVFIGGGQPDERTRELAGDEPVKFKLVVEA